MHVQAVCRYTLEVRATTERIPGIRRILAAHLRHWKLESQIAPVCRAVGELLGNVVRHVPGDKTCVVELRWTGRRLTVSVADRGRGLPRLTGCCPAKGGLAAVAVLSDSWGTCATETGKVIWFSRLVAQPGNVPRTAHGPRRTVPALMSRPLSEPSHRPDPPDRPGAPAPAMGRTEARAASGAP
ncbi:ATP-binding protein [Streptomyces jumonjinensis]|uniref:ATP-binding protein n=1 Tax=Streptomyces jumonjinensis TaxID=1945 RepID=UPI0037A301FF